MASIDEQTDITNVKHELKLFMTKHKIDDTHGYKHALDVLENAKNICNTSTLSITTNQRLCIFLASLLHDVDDGKYFNTTNYENCRHILQKCDCEKMDIDNVVHMISLVSCSKNGNSSKGCSYLWQLIPRYADRIESTGKEGLVRCYKYNLLSNSPLYDENTPQCKTRDEIFEHATYERFQEYIKNNGNSATMMDHYYDKLIQVSYPPKEHIVHSEYLINKFEKSVEPLLDVCLYYGKNGRLSPTLFKNNE